MLALPAAGRGEAASDPAYRDDRSTAEAVVRSLYNAIERREYLRGWSYFRDEPGRPSLDDFVKGYADTADVRIKVGQAASDGAAGSTYYAVPVAVRSVSKTGTVQVFTGCYLLRLVQPALQEKPPFQPMGIVKGSLAKTPALFNQVSGSCTGML